MTGEFDNIGSTAYNKYTNLPNFSYICIKHLLDENELIFKLLKYNTPDAWNKSDLSSDEKRALIYQGQSPMEDYHIFMDNGQSDAWTKQTTVLRIYPYEIYPNNRTIGTIVMCFEVFSHYLINHLSNYTVRVDSICQQLIDEFNGFNLGEVGRLEFNNRMGSISLRLNATGQVPYSGKYVLMSTKSGTGIQGAY
jgi:hypothetical protein